MWSTQWWSATLSMCRLFIPHTLTLTGFVYIHNDTQHSRSRASNSDRFQIRHIMYIHSITMHVKLRACVFTISLVFETIREKNIRWCDKETLLKKRWKQKLITIDAWALDYWLTRSLAFMFANNKQNIGRWHAYRSDRWNEVTNKTRRNEMNMNITAKLLTHFASPAL